MTIQGTPAIENASLSAILRRLIELRQDQEADEYGAQRASLHAFQLTSQLLTEAASVAASECWPIPAGCASTDTKGGVHIAWLRVAAGVSLVVPPTADRDAYIYHEVGTQFATEPATGEALARWLRVID